MIKKIYLLSLILLTMVGCSESKETHFITNDDYRALVTSDFKKVEQELAAGGRFTAFEQEMTLEEREALMFLYAYMPLSDVADYSDEFFLKNVRLAFEARDMFSWGSEVPEDVFRHFVLPHRINNEDVDGAREVFLAELAPRLKGMTLHDAALEVNHWCHEKANYQPTDSRTISPLGILKTAYGRCGEESTFTVTALRSVGIPARQVYTPRWAHVDDNHAWVEVYVDGKWSYLGACEPKSDLNIGWFSAPVLRAMMVHTKAFGRYNGTENVIYREDKFTTLNTLNNYAPTKKIWVKVVNEDNTPAKGAEVEIGLYNYAEYYPIKTQTTEADGLAFIITGFGDLRIFASDGDRQFGIEKIAVEQTDTATIVLNRTAGESFTVDYENVPPVEKALPDADVSGVAANEVRFAQEDSIREVYISTFYDAKKAQALQAELGTSQDLTAFMVESRGNYPQLERYFKATIPQDDKLSVRLIQQLVVKDFHDIEARVLEDHFNNYKLFSTVDYDEAFADQYVLNPRIYLERLSPYRAYLQEEFFDMVKTSPEKTAESVLAWINENITLNEEDNYYDVAISPRGVMNVKQCDAFSQKLFFVAVMRSLGVASRLDPVTHEAQYFAKAWLTVKFDNAQKAVVADKTVITLKTAQDYKIDPQYRIHFSIAKYAEGHFETLHYDWEKPLSEFPNELEIAPGYYQILTGNRLPDGTVLVHQEFINLRKGENRTVTLTINQNLQPAKVLAQWDALKDRVDLRVVGWIDPHTEPGNHFFYDFKSLKKTFEQRGVDMTIYCKDTEDVKDVTVKLPKQATVNIDGAWQQLGDFSKATGLSSKLPVFIVVNKQGEVLFHSAGYNIGTAEQLLKKL